MGSLSSALATASRVLQRVERIERLVLVAGELNSGQRSSWNHEEERLLRDEATSSKIGGFLRQSRQSPGRQGPRAGDSGAGVASGALGWQWGPRKRAREVKQQ